MTAPRTVTPQPKMDFLADLAKVAKQRLLAAGYTVKAGETPDAICIKYMNVLRRRVAIQPREVKIATILKCPAEVKDGFEFFVNKANSGGDLRPHQSKFLLDADYEDAMLNDWSIFHFHLERKIGSKGFVDRTGLILYAMVTPDTVYCIDILPHERWAEQDLLETVHREWPQVIERFKAKGFTVLASHTEKDRLGLRKAGVNTFTVMQDGTVYFPPGGGYSTARTSVPVRMLVDQWVRLCSVLQDATTQRQKRFLEAAKSAKVTLPDPFPIHLVFTENRASAFEPRSGFKLPLADWRVPEL